MSDPTQVRRATAAVPWKLLAAIGIVVALVPVVGPGRSLAIASTVVGLLFVVFLLRHLLFVASAVAHADRDLVRGRALGPLPPAATLPTVAVVSACHNEVRVVERLVGALVALEYPAERMQLIVVDDGSSDGTGA